MLRPASLPPSRRSELVTWGAAALIAAALYVVPYATIGSIVTGAAGRWVAILAGCVVVLVVAAIRLWSALVVLAAAVVSGIFGAIAWFVVVVSDTCGGSNAATVVEWTGAAAIALGLGAWAVHYRGGRVFWGLPLGWVLGAIWIAIVAHVIPGGAGGCIE